MSDTPMQHCPVIPLGDVHGLVFPGIRQALQFTLTDHPAAMKIITASLWSPSRSSPSSTATLQCICMPAIVGTGDRIRAIGCLADVLRVEKAGGRFLVVVLGVERCWLERNNSDGDQGWHHVGTAVETPLDGHDTDNDVAVAKLRRIGADLITRLLPTQSQPQLVKQLLRAIKNAPPGRLADFMAHSMLRHLTRQQQYAVLAELDVAARVDLVLGMAEQSSSVPALTGQSATRFIDHDAAMQVVKRDDNLSADVDSLVQQASAANVPASVRKVVDREMSRLLKMPPSQSEHSMIRSYVECLVELPWLNPTSTAANDDINLARARQLLEQDHFGMERVKTRVMEFLAVCKLKRDFAGAILCLVGPPGVGKTSIAQSIAAAMKRKFQRISLGGARDVADIKGHRRTYIGAMPGLIMQAIRSSGVNDPVMLLDEIDKVGREAMRGDPTAALLEALDPEQNSQFQDHYVNLPFDLSRVTFIATANDLSSIQPALLDRMEVVRLQAYTAGEKCDIATRHLLPKQLKRHGLSEDAVVIAANIIQQLVWGYTREAGVRQLERCLAAICRSAAMAKAEQMEQSPGEQSTKFMVTSSSDLERVLGKPKHIGDHVADSSENGTANSTVPPGVITGLSWNQAGYGALLYIECTASAGTGKLSLTGKLGEVLKESAQIAYSWVMANIRTPRRLDKLNVHIHFPAGAIPKDGPSAGLAIATALVSMLTEVPVPRTTAMTGEISLQGRVLPVGGIGEKVEAAERGGVTRCILPSRNSDDLMEWRKRTGGQNDSKLDVVFVDTVQSCLEHIFGRAEWWSSTDKTSLHEFAAARL